MLARKQQVGRGIARRSVQIVERLGQRLPRLSVDRPRCERVGEVVVQAFVRERDASALHDPAHALLMQPFGRRVDGRQMGVGLGVVVTDDAIFGVDHFRTRGARAHLAVTAHAPASLERLLLRTVEIKEPQRDRAGAIRQPAQQRAAAAVRDLAELDDALDESLIADAQAAQGPKRGAILVALRQQAQKIADREHAEPREPLGHLRPHAREARGRPIEERVGQRDDPPRLQDQDAVDLDGGPAR